AGREDDARRFYAELLEIPELPKPASLSERGGVWFESRGVKLHGGVDPDFRPARKAHPALIARDLRTLLQRLREAGFEGHEELPETSDGEPMAKGRHAYVTDPFGNRLELMESTG